jgi:Domain of unknown function (DUF1707)
MQSGSNPPYGSYPPGPGYNSGPGSRPSAYRGNPALRASDADRDRVVDQLSLHFQAGRLTSDEFDERSTQALQARTLGDLDGLLTDLPALPVADPAPTGQAPVSRRDAGVSGAAGMLGVLAVVAVIVVLSRTGYGAVGGWGFIIPVLIVWRLLARRHHDD